MRFYRLWMAFGVAVLPSLIILVVDAAPPAIPELRLVNVAGSSSEPPPGGRSCGSTITEEKIQATKLKTESFFKKGKSQLADAAAPVFNATHPLHLDVYFHVVMRNKTVEGGWVPQGQILAQVAVLNNDYADIGIKWTLRNTSNTVNRQWFDNVGPGSPEEASMKRLHREGGASALNVYTTGFTSGAGKNMLGYSSFPWDFEDDPMDDGIVILYSSLPGGTAAPYNLGRTLTHEVGHWIGLYHTFQGGCVGDGDMVDDTPAEEFPALGCPEKRDTCVEAKGLDPIHNYMDYTDDSCMVGFSKGQMQRAQEQMSIYRIKPVPVLPDSQSPPTDNSDDTDTDTDTDNNTTTTTTTGSSTSSTSSSSSSTSTSNSSTATPGSSGTSGSSGGGGDVGDVDTLSGDLPKPEPPNTDARSS